MKLLSYSFTHVTNLTMTYNYKAVKTGTKALVQNATNNNNFRILGVRSLGILRVIGKCQDGVGVGLDE